MGLLLLLCVFMLRGDYNVEALNNGCQLMYLSRGPFQTVGLFAVSFISLPCGLVRLSVCLTDD